MPTLLACLHLHLHSLSPAEATLEAERAAHLAAAASRDQMAGEHQQQLALELAAQERSASQRLAQLEVQLKDIR